MHDRQTSATKATSQIRSARELIGLHTYEADDRHRVSPASGATNARDGDLVYGLVVETETDVPGIAKTLPSDEVFGQCGEASQGIAGQDSAPVTHYIAIIVILRRFDEIEERLLGRHAKDSLSRPEARTETSQA